MTFKIRIKPDSLSVFFYGTDTFTRVVLIGKFDSILSVSHTNNFQRKNDEKVGGFKKSEKKMRN